MPVIADALLYLSRAVSDLDGAMTFYIEALGFEQASDVTAIDARLSELLGTGRAVMLARGAQRLELACFDVAGAPYPPESRSCDLWFQHCALATDDIVRDYATLCRHRFTPITRGGPQALPGGIVAYKFRDGDGHPLELIQFPDQDPATKGGIDHVAIAVSAGDASVAFYQAELGMRLLARQTNTGPAQDALDGLGDAVVDVVALSPKLRAPHLELLAYRHPLGCPVRSRKPTDIAASRLVFQVGKCPGGEPVLRSEPDGHALLLLPGAWLSD